jgi:hypothetical protein
MNQAQYITGKFKSSADLARALGHKHSSVVCSWRRRGFIPVKQHEKVMAAAKKLKVKLTPNDFFFVSLKGTPNEQ